MSIVVGSETKLVVSGLTGREGSFHGLRNRAYGTDLVAGVTPGKGGQDVEGVPVFDEIAEAVSEAGANTSMIFVPARFAAPAIDEAIESGVETVIAITEGIPVLDMLKIYWKAKEAGVRLIGPNCPGVLSPGKANVGIIPAQFFDPGPIGVVSKSGTLTYQIGNELKQAGDGNSSIVGIGGDPIIGSDFIDILTLYEADPETELIVMVGEIGGDAEERAAEFIAAEVSKPVVAYIAGFTAPPGKQMGHAGAIISGSSGTAAGKEGRARSEGRPGRRKPDRDGDDRRRSAARLLGPARDALGRSTRARVGAISASASSFLLQAAVGEADNPVAGHLESGVAGAVALEGGAVTVEFPAVELDASEALPWPEGVDLVAEDVRVEGRHRQADASRQKAAKSSSSGERVIDRGAGLGEQAVGSASGRGVRGRARMTSSTASQLAEG